MEAREIMIASVYGARAAANTLPGPVTAIHIGCEAWVDPILSDIVAIMKMVCLRAE
jgi:hypothetical protein